MSAECNQEVIHLAQKSISYVSTRKEKTVIENSKVEQRHNWPKTSKKSY